MNSTTGQVAPGFVPPTGEPTREKNMAMKAAVRLSDPTHRFHQPTAGHDMRSNYAASAARQQLRGRRSGTP